MSVQILKGEEFKGFIENNSGTVLVDFYADWCVPCKMVAPILEKISNDRTDVQVVKLNVDECGELAEQYGVASIPTMVVLKNGEVTNVKTGLCPEEEILNLLV